MYAFTLVMKCVRSIILSDLALKFSYLLPIGTALSRMNHETGESQNTKGSTQKINTAAGDD